MTETRGTLQAKARAWITDFHRERPLYVQFPLRLANGMSVPGIHVTCSSCNGRISGDRVHGRVVPSLPHVVTVSANGFCEQCNRLTHVDCRFRVHGGETVIEWLATNGRWQARELRQPMPMYKVRQAARRLLEWAKGMM